MACSICPSGVPTLIVKPCGAARAVAGSISKTRPSKQLFMEFSYRGNLSQTETLWERVEQPPRNPDWLIAIRLADSGGKTEQRFADRNTAHFNVLQVRGSDSPRFSPEKRVVATHE